TRRSPVASAPAVLLALGCVWGASFLFIKVLVDDTGPLEVATGRLCIGAVAILSFIRLRGLPVPWTPSLVAKVSVLALVANIAPFALIAWGEEHIESGTASVLNSTMPIFTAIFATSLLPEERFTTARAGGLVVGAGATGVAYVAYLWLIDVTGSVRASLVTYIIPVVGLFLGWAVLDESIGINIVVGSALIIGGVAMVLRGGSPGTQTRPVA